MHSESELRLRLRGTFGDGNVYSGPFGRDNIFFVLHTWIAEALSVTLVGLETPFL